ncbi:MAG TPA: hypothetical protein VE890_04780 [Thermoguttaceae bacterium]|nr:hypothetical protein [Thermoguttaceae bacterium]
MPRSRKTDSGSPGHDSFLDIVANMVGILIILVMVVGVRVKNTPVTAAIPTEPDPLQVELKQELAAEVSLRSDVLRAEAEDEALRKETVTQGRQRDVLATLAAALEHEIESKRSQLDASSQEAFDLKRQMADKRLELEELQRKRMWIETAPAEPIVVESLPTPLSRTVDGREFHCQLRGGRIVPIPLDDLMDTLKDDMRHKVYQLRDLPETTATVGPSGGFRLRYTIRRHDITPEMAMQSGRMGSFVQVERWTLIPLSSSLGESVDMALTEGSEFLRTVAKYRPEQTTVTIWTYPDSFGSFRRVKRALYEMGFATAARPLPEGVPIGGSPSGQKSSAQ